MKTPEEYAHEFFEVLDGRRHEGWGQTRQQKVQLLAKVIEKAISENKYVSYSDNDG